MYAFVHVTLRASELSNVLALKPACTDTPKTRSMNSFSDDQRTEDTVHK